MTDGNGSFSISRGLHGPLTLFLVFLFCPETRMKHRLILKLQRELTGGFLMRILPLPLRSSRVGRPFSRCIFYLRQSRCHLETKVHRAIATGCSGVNSRLSDSDRARRNTSTTQKLRRFGAVVMEMSAAALRRDTHYNHLG